MKVKILHIGILLCLFGLSETVSAQETDSLDHKTAFRKGRWTTGLSGSISSGFNNLDTAASGTTRNQYTLDFQTGSFVKDRFLVGGIIAMTRRNSEEFTDRTLETFFIGPVITWYLTESTQGSLFLTGSTGYVSFRDQLDFVQAGIASQSLIDGNGIGMLVRFGYSYVLHDRVAFDLGLNYNHSWLGAEISEQPANITRSESFIVGDISFSFGFNVILDGFFF